ncbi:MAG: large subunit ribosomal protein [Solirubrobacterales bacterium]|jgi:large subunit ribosomal protein L30|nr:large subunit ribosomal protein [Solirubrobacterales bacterium]MDX6653085.1 large subunit ribosomal protein [Solirubrobacterales bacterium]
MSKLRIKQVRSRIGSKANQRATLRSLGLGRIGSTTERESSPQLQGMLHSIRHLVEVEES